MITVTRVGRTHWEERGRRIKQARMYAGLSQDQLAASVSDLLGYEVGRQIIHILEKGTRGIRVDELRGISAALDQTEEWLDDGPGARFNEAPIVHDLLLTPWFPRPIDIDAETASLLAA